MSFSYIGQCFQLFIDTALENPEDIVKSYLEFFHNSKQNRKTPTGSFSITIFVMADGGKIMRTFLGHIAISQPKLKIMS